MLARLIKCSVLALGFALFAGCAENKLTRENYDLIREGASTKQEVKSAMGEKYLNDRGGQWEYDDEKRHLSVWFEFDDRGVVTRKQWWSGEGGLEHDTKSGQEGEKMHDGMSTSTTDR